MSKRKKKGKSKNYSSRSYTSSVSTSSSYVTTTTTTTMTTTTTTTTTTTSSSSLPPSEGDIVREVGRNFDYIYKMENGKKKFLRREPHRKGSKSPGAITSDGRSAYFSNLGKGHSLK